MASEFPRRKIAGIFTPMDADDNGYLDEVLLVVDRLGAMTESVVGTAEAMFEAVDEDADGKISSVEYRQLVEAWTGRDTETDEVFGLLDVNGDRHLSREEFSELWTEFWPATIRRPRALGCSAGSSCRRPRTADP
jgi:Ca2+-binding EF-hand superfamily protein